MKSLKNLFEPRMFTEVFAATSHSQLTKSMDDNFKIAVKAQQILDKYIEENGVKVYGYKANHGWMFDDRICEEASTHTGIVLDIQPLKQCEHKEAVYVENKNRESWFECRDCGKPVKAKGWEVV